MTKNMKNTAKLKILAILIALTLICFSMFFFVACGGSSTSNKKDPSFKPNVAEETVSNGSFENGISSTQTNYPISSVSNWSNSSDTSSSSSNINSGIISTTEAGWKKTVSNLYEDLDFKNFISKKYDLDFSNVEKEDAVNSIIEKFASPATYGEGAGTNVYMINNYKTGNLGLGAAQRLTTSSNFTLTKGTFAKITVWVKTANLNELGTGANIRLVNTVNGATQASYNIYDIDTTNVTENNGWKLYTIYVKANELSTSTLKISLGLGMGNSSNNAQFFTEGTAFFDGVNFHELTEEEYVAETSGKTKIESENETFKYVSSNTTDTVKVKSGDGDYYFYSLSTEDSLNKYTENYYKNFSFTVDNKFTSSSLSSNGDEITSETIFGNNSNVDFSYNAGEIKLENIKNAAYTLTIKSDEFKVGYEKYLYINFKVYNGLSKLDSSDGIKVYVHDIKEGEKDIITASSATFENKGEWTDCSLVLQNNFPNDSKYIENKEFFIVITIGPDVVNTSSTFANGEVIFKDFKFARGSKDSEDVNYNYYKLFSSISKPIALINGEGLDYSESSSSEYYALSVAPSDAGTITTYPAIPQNYTGVKSEHFYVNPNGTTAITDDRSGNVNSTSRAGLINTKYLDKYAEISSLSSIKEALGWKNTQDNIQPLMIYNANEDSYGYIGSTTYVAASSSTLGTNCVVMEVSLKVVGDAKAYIYVVDLSSPEKGVMTIDVKSNTNGVKYLEETSVGEKRLAFEGITETNGWVTYKIYIVHGTEDKNIRLELWNGSRDGVEKSQGYVFFNGIQTSVSTNQIYPSDYTDITGSSNPIAENYSSITEKYLYKPVLTEREKEYNKKYPESAVSYAANYIWAETNKMIYAAYNLQDPIVNDPFESVDTDDSTSSDTNSNINSGNLWLSLSSIILGVSLLGAIIALIVKNVRRRRIANASDAKVHYDVRSRARVIKNEQEKKKNLVKENLDDYVEEDYNESEEDYVALPEKSEEQSEITETLDDYVYSDVQDFGETNFDGDKKDE